MRIDLASIIEPLIANADGEGAFGPQQLIDNKIFFALFVADLNGDLVNDIVTDYAVYTNNSADCNGNRLPDVCEDCTGTTIADPCEIAAGTALDCNDNAVPDSCDTECTVDCDLDGDLDNDLVSCRNDTMSVMLGNGNGPLRVSSTRALRDPGGKCIVKMSRGDVTWSCQGYGLKPQAASSNKRQAPSLSR